MCESIHTMVENFKVDRQSNDLKLPTPKIICDSCDMEVEQSEIEEVNGFFLCNACSDTDREASID